MMQFRSRKLHLELVKCARQTYGDFVPDGVYYGMVGDDVHMYSWDLVPGPAFCHVWYQFLTFGS